MKLLKASLPVVEAEALVDRFKEQGILTFISSEKSKGLGGVFTGSSEVSVWVVLDEQYEDATALLNNPNHKVTNPLTAAEMDKFTQQSKQYLSRFNNKLLLFIFLFLLIVGLLIYAMRGYF